MSQQTQVETVMPYYLRFMEKYPQIEDLAAADDDELPEALGRFRLLLARS